MIKYAGFMGALIFLCASMAQASTTLGEASFNRNAETLHVDYIVTTTDLSTQNMLFHFASGLGGQTEYDASAYYYYYQLENTAQSSASTLTLNVNPSLIETAGYIDSADLDDPITFNHNFGGDTEITTLGPVNPLGVTFSPTGLVPHISWVFLFPPLAPSAESTVFFISSNSPEAPTLSLIDAGSPGIDGELPSPVPEPSAMLLFGLGGAWFIRKRRAKK